MFGWLKEHAWKAILATLTKRYRHTSFRNQFNDYPISMFFGVKL